MRHATDAGGNATVLAVLVAGIVAAVGFYVRMSAESSLEALSIEERRLGARMNNEAALELVGALAANRVIVRQGAGLVLGAGARNLAHGGDRLWRLVGNRRILVKTCNQTMKSEDAASVYGVQNDGRPETAGCMGREREETPVVVENVVDDQYVVFKATSRLKFRGQGEATQVVTRAQIRVAAFDDLIPHTGCRFMEPMKGPDGSALYYPDGKLILRPSSTWAAEHALSYDSTFYGDPNAPNLRALRGLLDGFLRQGYTGMRTVEATFNVPENVPVEPTFDRAAGKFQKFVYYLAGYRSGIAQWPADGLRNARLKTGCQRTIGDGTPDFCTRVDVLVKSTTFVFDAKHSCSGSGSAATGYSFDCPASPISPGVTATTHDHWACMYFSYHNVQKPAECSRQFRGYCRNGDGCFSPETMVRMNALGAGMNQREVRPLSMTMTERRAISGGRFQVRSQMSFATRCQTSGDPKFPRSMQTVELPPIPSAVCAGFACGRGARPVVDETRTTGGRTHRKIHPTRFMPSAEPVATAMCFQQLVGYVQVELWTARKGTKDGRKKYVWDRQATLIPLTPSLTGNVSYLPARD